MQARVLNNGMRMVMIRGALAAACLLGLYGQVMAEETATKSTTATEAKTSAASTKATTSTTGNKSTKSTTTTKSHPSVVVATVRTRDVSRRQFYVGRVQAIGRLTAAYLKLPIAIYDAAEVDHSERHLLWRTEIKPESHYYEYDQGWEPK
jgi:hypothetical protein